MLKLALRVGLSPSEFLELTPRELQLTIEVYAEKQKQLQNENITNAWLTAMWERCKKMPQLKEVLNIEQEINTDFNYQKVERIAREKGLKIPPNFYKERGQIDG